MPIAGPLSDAATEGHVAYAFPRNDMLNLIFHNDGELPKPDDVVSALLQVTSWMST